MITFVYCCICLLIVCCQTTRIESEEYDYTNDSPYTFPKVTMSRYKVGSDILMRCNNHHPNKDNITWEFKHCESNYKGIQCDKKNIYKLDSSDTDWKKLDFNRRRKKLEIKNVTEENVGLYRCLYNDSIIKIYMVGVDVAVKYTGPLPEVVAVIPSVNSTVLPNTPVVIQCKAKSIMPAEIRWLKESNRRKCDCQVIYNGRCYCPIPLSDFAYSTSNNIYLSKLNIYRARDIDSGTYVCVVISTYGNDFKNITIKVQEALTSEKPTKWLSLLFFIPLLFILVPGLIWLCFYQKKKKNRPSLNEHQKQLIKPVVQVDIVLNVDEVV